MAIMNMQLHATKIKWHIFCMSKNFGMKSNLTLLDLIKLHALYFS